MTSPSSSKEVPPKSAAHFIFELSQLSIEDRSGWLRLGIKAEPLCAHVLRTSQLAYVLAVSEGHENPAYVTTLAVFHENEEARTRDPNAITKRYVTIDKVAAMKDQTANLGALGESIFEMWNEVEQQKTPAGIIAKDADRLEMAFRAKELMKQGHADAKVWLDGVGPALKTASARQLYEALLSTDPHDWWKIVTQVPTSGA